MTALVLVGTAAGGLADSATATTRSANHGRGPGGPAGPFGGSGLVGIVTGTSSSSFTLTLTAADEAAGEPAGSSVTVTTTSTTTYGEQGAPGSSSTPAPTSVTTGQLVQVAATSSTAATSTPTAARVEIVGPTLTGTVLSVTGSVIVIRDDEGFERTIHTSSSTTYAEGTQSVSSSAVGMNSTISAFGTLDANGTDLDASAVTVVLDEVAGQVQSVSGSTITIAEVGRGHGATTSTIALDTSSSTTFSGGSTKTISDVVQNDLVVATGTWTSTGTFSALTVSIGSGHGFFRQLGATTTSGWGRGGRGGPRHTA